MRLKALALLEAATGRSEAYLQKSPKNRDGDKVPRKMDLKRLSSGLKSWQVPKLPRGVENCCLQEYITAS